MTETTVPPSSPSVEERLVFRDHELIQVHNGGYQWIDVQGFTFPAGTADRAVIELLIRHVRYRHGYAGPDFRDAKIIHGPYWLEAISVESYSPVSPVSAEALITTWANYDAVIADTDYPVLNEKVFGPIRHAGSVYQLADLRAAAEHDWGYVVGLTGFHEFAATDHDTNRLTLIVASDD